MNTTKKNKALPLIVVAIVSLAVGAGAFTLLQKPGDTSAAQNVEKNALAQLQESLQTSLALPSDFRTVQEFQLTDANSDVITQSVFEDKWSLVFFGFTQCPDICPITLQVMKEVVEKVEAQGQAEPQVVFVSVDPARDTAELMKQYIAYFDESFIGITGDVNDVHELTSSLGIVASFTANDTDPDAYGVDHTASLLLIDPQRRVRAKVTPPHEAQKIVDDYLLLTAFPS